MFIFGTNSQNKLQPLENYGRPIKNSGIFFCLEF